MINRGLTYQETITMITEVCCNCGVAFGIPSDLRKVLQSDSDKWFYCPNGHSQHYSKSTEDKLREQMTNQQKRHEQELERLNNQFLDEFNSRIKAEKQLKRVHKGVCPCCNRSFANLGNHMKTKHPDLLKK